MGFRTDDPRFHARYDPRFRVQDSSLGFHSRGIPGLSMLPPAGTPEPPDIPKRLWLDGMDTETRLLDPEDSTVLTWFDKSGNDSHFVKPATNSKWPVATLDGLGVQFNATTLSTGNDQGEHSWLECPGKVILGRPADTFVVFENVESQGATGIIASVAVSVNRHASVAADRLLSRNSASNFGHYHLESQEPVGVTDRVLVHAQHIPGDLISRVNDNEPRSRGTTSTNPTSNLETTYLGLTNRLGAAQVYSRFILREVIVIDGGDIDEEGREAVRDYLNAKWNIW